MQIALMLERSDGREIPFAVRPEHYQSFADELGRRVENKVQIVQGELGNAPANGYVLFAATRDISMAFGKCCAEFVAQLAPRLVLFDVGRQNALKQLEEYQLAGAVDSLRLSAWMAGSSRCVGPFGRSYLATSLGASCVRLSSYRSEHYCLFQSNQHQGLGYLLAEYLKTYDRDQVLLSQVPSVSLLRVPHHSSQISAKTDLAMQEEPVLESVPVPEVVKALLPARKKAGMSLEQVAQESRFHTDPLALLEKGDFGQVQLRALRAYLLALEPSWGWRLAQHETTYPRHRDPEKSKEREFQRLSPSQKYRIELARTWSE